MENKVLVIEDMPEFQRLIQMALGHKYNLDFASSLEQARKLLNEQNYLLCLLDIVLPDGSGIDFYRELQLNDKFNHMATIILTSKNAVSDRVLGISLGVDDYIVKPFDNFELLARVDLRILKSFKKKEIDQNYKLGPLRFEISGLRLFIKSENQEKKIDLTPIEFKILLKLAQGSNRIFSRQQLLDSVWGYNVYVDDRTIDKHVSSIRKKIEPYQKLIKTVSGIGYELKSS